MKYDDDIFDGDSLIIHGHDYSDDEELKKSINQKFLQIVDYCNEISDKLIPYKYIDYMEVIYDYESIPDIFTHIQILFRLYIYNSNEDHENILQKNGYSYFLEDIPISLKYLLLETWGAFKYRIEKEFERYKKINENRKSEMEKLKFQERYYKEEAFDILNNFEI